ncbi:MAG: heme-binding protein [Candidatus Theseobacter exili]|nr:heme-binding protein [Candidatus Theseobacter exili]
MRWLQIIFAVLVMIVGGNNIMAIEEAPYKVVKKNNKFEIRDYDTYIIAETSVTGNLEEAGNKAFGKLFKYISGNNKAREKVAMTSPVTQKADGEKIKMTAPVEQQKAKDSWKVSFVMPSSYTMKTIPKPDDSNIILKEIPARRIAAIRYSGTWSEKRYLQHKLKLENWISTNNLTSAGDVIWARYNPPFTPWFLRRNEVLIPINSNDKQKTSDKSTKGEI